MLFGAVQIRRCVMSAAAFNVLTQDRTTFATNRICMRTKAKLVTRQSEGKEDLRGTQKSATVLVRCET